MESHNQEEPLKIILEWLSKKVLFDEVTNDFLDDNPSNDKIENGVLVNDELNDTLKSALKKDIKSINECIKAIDLVDQDKISEESKEELLNLRNQLVAIKEDVIREKYAGVEDITQQEFRALCTKKIISEGEVKKIVKHALNNKEDEIVSLMSIETVPNEIAEYLKDAPILYIPGDILTEQQEVILTNREEI